VVTERTDEIGNFEVYNAGALAGALYAAYKAAKKDPIDVLEYE
jgi:ABC-type lipoprotein release transport system permease subunit